MKIITMTLLKLDKNQQKERENVNTTDLALTYIRKPQQYNVSCTYDLAYWWNE